GDAHIWDVWHGRVPFSTYETHHARFVTEYGFQSFPEMKTIRKFAKPEDFDIRSTTMQSHQKNKGGNSRILTYMLREYPEPKNFESYVYLSQVQQAEAIKVGAEHLRRNRPRTMGSMFWQLNDCWPVASWASIDYYGNWKALQYYARDFYHDVLVSPWMHDGRVELYVVSDRQQVVPAKLRVRLLDFGGKTILDQSKDVQVQPLSSSIYQVLDQQNLLTGADPKQVFLVVDLLGADNQRISRNTVFFDQTKDLALPASPAIDSTLVPAGNGAYALTLRSPQLARHVFVDFGDYDAKFSQNYVDLLPGESLIIQVHSASSLDQLRSAMHLTHLMQAFNPPAGAK
ncbi:MAG TPA: glycoside hydrolase family 2 protein, partial [Terriglobales bacterium]